MFKRILVVCIGNICRSPMAEALLADAFRRRSMDTAVESCGLGALVGEQADPAVKRLMEERGIDVSRHRARQIEPEMLRSADIVLVMDKRQQRAVYEMEPSVRGRVFRVGEWRDTDIPDPYRKSDEMFENALRLIEQGVSDWMERLDRG